MKVKALDTGRIANLQIFDSNGTCYANDCIGNSGGFYAGEQSIDIKDDEYVIAKDEDLKFWEDFCDREQAQGRALEILRAIGFEPDLSHAFTGDIESYQKCYIELSIDALENKEHLRNFCVSKKDAEHAKEELSDLLKLKCFS